LQQCVFLQLFNALSNNEERKLHLIKEPFEYLLTDFIGHLKKKNTLSIDRIRILVGEKSKLETEIEKTFEFFSSRGIFLREDEHLEMEDFVVCRDWNGSQVLKFHSLSKLEKGERTQSMFQNKGLVSRVRGSNEKV
jgi:hypothetical protein